MKRIFFFGDSIAFGQWVNVSDTWVVMLSKYLSEKYGDIAVNNPSINGDTTRMALERMPHDIQNKDIFLLVIEFGINDCNYWLTDQGVPRVSELAFEANLKEMVQRAFAFDTKHVLMLTNHVTGKNEILPKTNIVFQKNVETYNTIIRKVVDSFESNVKLADVEKEFKDYINQETSEEGRMARTKSLLMPDLIHLNQSGHKMYFEIIKKYVETYYGNDL